MEDSNSQPAVRINGALMNSYLQQKAIIVGFVTKIDPDGKRATLKTTDDEFIQLLFSTPLNFSLQPNQLVEAYGTVTNRNQFQCLNFTHFLPEASEKFDCKIYNKFLSFFIEHNSRINIMSQDTDEEEILQNLNNNFEVDWKIGAENSTSLNDSIATANSWN